MVSGAKARQGSVLATGSSMVPVLWETGADELLELLEEEISEEILDQMEATKIPKKSKKIANRPSRKLNKQNTKKKRQENNKKF